METRLCYFSVFSWVLKNNIAKTDDSCLFLWVNIETTAIKQGKWRRWCASTEEERDDSRFRYNAIQALWIK
jgi:hypothetical protein